MLRFLKICLALLVLLLGTGPAAKAFSLLGPPNAWTITRLGYMQPGDIGVPMALNAGYRWNTPVITYAYDQSFLQYFGVHGVEAVDGAFDILNSLPPFSQMSRELTEYPQTDMLRINHQASALGILDLKTWALHFLMEELGLADPVRYTWTLIGRQVFAGPVTNYTVIKLNWDPVTLAPSSFVNGSLYGYTILDDLLPGPYADAIPIPLDTPLINSTPVAATDYGLAGAGQFFVGLTRDDVAGLRHLYESNNFIGLRQEMLLPGSLIAVTNRTTQLVLTNQDLRTFELLTTGTTNAPAALLALYPNLLITSTNARLAVAIETNILSFFTNIPPQQVTITNMVTNIVTLFDYTFGNVVTNLQTGTFHIVPPNLFGFELVGNLLTNVVAVTNVTPTLNIFVNTNLQTLLSTIDLVTFSSQARTNAPADLLAIYPDLVIVGTNMQISTEVQTNFSFFLTNHPWAPATAPPTVVFVPELTNVLVTNWNYTFANVVTNTFAAVGRVTIQEMRVTPAPWSTDGSLTTNFINTTYWSNFINGTVYIVPTNVLGFQFVRTLLTNVNVISNNLNPTIFGGTMLVATNGTNLVITNFFGTNFNAVFTNVAELIFQTNFTYAVHPIEPGTTLIESISLFTNVISAVFPIEFQAATNVAGLRPGVDKLHFIKTSFDSLLGTAYTPITNQYFDTIITNGRPVRQVVRRIITQPDILFLAQNLALPTPQALTPPLVRRTDTSGWINHDALNGAALQGGPGVIPPQVRIIFNDVLPYFSNSGSAQFQFLDHETAIRSAVWGSFDGTTNAPIIFPNYISLQMLENMVLNPNP
jgi:hypothetical protein